MADQQLARIESGGALATFDREQIDLIKRTVAKDASDTELELFLYTAQRRGLDPLTKQIHFVKRGGQATIQTGIDGFRVIAERTGKYAPGRDTDFRYDEKGKLVSATAYVQKLVCDRWFEVAATAMFAEYAQSFGVWPKMPHVMLEKSAESRALRRAFPESLSGLYTDDEMQQADAPTETRAFTLPPVVVERTLAKDGVLCKCGKPARLVKGKSGSGYVCALDPKCDFKQKLESAAPVKTEAAQVEFPDTPPHPLDDVAHDYTEGEVEEPSPLTQAVHKKVEAAKVRPKVTAFRVAAEKAGLDFSDKSRAARLAAMDAWLLANGYKRDAPVTSTNDVADGILILMSEDLGNGLKWDGAANA